MPCKLYFLINLDNIIQTVNFGLIELARLYSALQLILYYWDEGSGRYETFKSPSTMGLATWFEILGNGIRIRKYSWAMCVHHYSSVTQPVKVKMLSNHKNQNWVIFYIFINIHYTSRINLKKSKLTWKGDTSVTKQNYSLQICSSQNEELHLGIYVTKRK